MKKTLWMLGVAVAALTSCTQSEVLDVPESRTISFETFLGKSSRATEYNNVSSVMLKGTGPADNDLNAFWVYGSFNSDVDDNDDPDLFINTHVYWDTNNNAFTYASPKQWYEGIYNFSAYSDGNNTLTNVMADLTNRKLTFTDYENNGSKDLVAAIPAAIEKMATNMTEGVSLDFKHMLSCIELYFSNASSDLGFALDFTDVKFTAVSKGTCVYNAASDTDPIVWTFANPAERSVYEFRTNDPNLDDDNDSNDAPLVMLAPGQFTRLYCFVIPQSNENIELTFNIKSYERKNPQTVGGSTTYDYHYTGVKQYQASLKFAEDGIDYKWKPGRLYRYTAEVSGSVHYINFSVSSIDNWNATGNEHNTTYTPQTPNP